MLSNLQEQLDAPGACLAAIVAIQRTILKGYIAEYLATHPDSVLDGVLREFFPEQPTLLDAVVVLRDMFRGQPVTPIAISSQGDGR